MLQTHRAPGSGWFSCPGMCYPCMSPNLAHCAHLCCSGLHCGEWHFLGERNWFVFNSVAQLVCHLFSTVFPLESHSGVSGFCPGRVLAPGISQSKQRAEIREMTAPCRQQTQRLWGCARPFWWGTESTDPASMASALLHLTLVSSTSTPASQLPSPSPKAGLLWHLPNVPAQAP